MKKSFWLDRLHFYPSRDLHDTAPDNMGEIIIKFEGLGLQEMVEIEKKLREFLLENTTQ